MTSFLFWNLQKKDLRHVLADAVKERAVDILVLAESVVPDHEIATALNASTGGGYLALPDAMPDDKVRVVTRIPANRWTRRYSDSTRLMIWSVEVGRHPGILLAGVHLRSKLRSSPDDQRFHARPVAEEIGRTEDAVGHQRTVLVGDLNMDTFEAGVTAVDALHAVMTRTIAGRATRTLADKQYRFFYNPMWSLHGDRTAGPPGTHFHYDADSSDLLYWHMLDQVLLRPELMDALHGLEIVDRVAGRSLLTPRAGHPDSSLYSDHLPLAFRLHLD